MKIVVTGGYGFIGSYLIRKLVNNKKNIVLNLDKVTDTSIPQSLHDLKNDNYLFSKVDICNYNLLENIISNFKPNIIFHLAAESHVDTSIKYPKNLLRQMYWVLLTY